MNNRFMISYTPGTTPLHRLNGATKVLGFIAITMFIIMTFDVRVLLPMLLFCVIGIISMRPNWKPIIFVFCFLTVMAGLLGSLTIVLFLPGSGYTHVGAETVLVRFSDRFFISRELLWYVGILYFKRVCSLASAVLFVLAITPSELAAGFNKIGLPYKGCTILSLAFRTIPDIAREFEDIRNSMMMRGVELDSRKAGIGRRLRQTTMILIPLIMSVFDKVGNIVNAMDLRGYAKLKKRSWYSDNDPTRADWIARAVVLLIMAFNIFYIVYFRFMNPPPFSFWSPWTAGIPTGGI